MRLSNQISAPIHSALHTVFEDRESYPSALALLWPLKLTASGILKSAKGVNPTYTDTPTLSAGGVVPGDGPSFTSVVTWADGGTRVWEITMSTAAADLVGDVAVGGGLSVSSAGLKFSDGTNVSTWATTWAANALVTAIVLTMDDGVRTLMRVVRGEDV